MVKVVHIPLIHVNISSKHWQGKLSACKIALLLNLEGKAQTNYWSLLIQPHVLLRENSGNNSFHQHLALLITVVKAFKDGICSHIIGRLQ